MIEGVQKNIGDLNRKVRSLTLLPNTSGSSELQIDEFTVPKRRDFINAIIHVTISYYSLNTI